MNPRLHVSWESDIFQQKKLKTKKIHIFLLPNWFWWDHKSEKIVSSSLHKMLKMNSFNRTILVLGLLLPMVFALAPSQIRLDPDGGYTGIVIKIDKEVPEEMCTQILSNLQVRTHQFICRDKKILRRHSLQIMFVGPFWLHLNFWRRLFTHF